MKILVDTHILIWLLSGDSMLSRSAQRILEDERNEFYFSSINIAEIAIKHVKNPLLMPLTPEQVREAALENNLRELDFGSSHAVALASLPLHHKDPFDRMLIAQAEGSQMKLMSHDDFIALYPVALSV